MLESLGQSGIGGGWLAPPGPDLAWATSDGLKGAVPDESIVATSLDAALTNRPAQPMSDLPEVVIREVSWVKISVAPSASN